MAKYYLNYAIDGRAGSEMEASSLQEAIEQGRYSYVDIDMDHMEVCDIRLVSVEDENGDIVWEA